MSSKTSTLIGVVSLILVAFAPATAFAQLEQVNLQSSDSSDAVSIRLTRLGPYPSSFTHAHGPFVLHISNQSGVIDDTYSLILKPNSGADPKAAQSLLDLHSDNTKQRDYQLIKLHPGDYELRFKSHPNWVVSITITAK